MVVPSTDPARHKLMLVFVDTNVWYPVVLADLVLRSVEIGLFDLAWTDESLAEVERVLVEHKGLTARNAAVFGEQVRATAPGGRLEPADYRPLVAAMTGPDPGDHVHAAAARGGRVDVLLTGNVADFPAEDVGHHCRVLHPGDLFGELTATYPLEIGRVVTEMAALRRRPTMAPEDILDRLDALGLRAMVGVLRQRDFDSAG
jgi:predicted nucleic acid-binding protein